MVAPKGRSLRNLSEDLAAELAKSKVDVVHVADWLGLSQAFREVFEREQGSAPIVICGLHGPTAWVREGSPVMAAEGHEADEWQQVQGETLAMQSADWLVSPSKALALWARDNHPNDSENKLQIKIQLNMPVIQHEVSHVAAEQPDSLIFYGRLEARKGIELFLNALSYLPRTPMWVHLVGADVVVRGRSQAHDTMDNLKRLGIRCTHHANLQRDEALSLVKGLGGVVIIPSLIENSPYAVQEFLGTGLRVVTTDVGGIPELIRTAGDSLCAPEAQALANAMAEALGDAGGKDRFRLEGTVEPDRIRLSWQAFHEALPAREAAPMVWPAAVLSPEHCYPDGILMITLDSCRYDTFRKTRTTYLDEVGPVHRAQAPSYFTYGSHAAMFKGFLPGITKAEPFLNSKFAKLFRLGHAGFQASSQTQAFLLEGNSIITGLRRQGYATIGSGAVNWFDTATETGRDLTQDFEHFWFAGNSWSLEAQLDWIEQRLRECGDRPPFVFLNIGETHVPYWHEGADWDRADNPCIPFQRADRRADCRKRQRSCLQWVDEQLAPLLHRFLPGTVVVCADHGDCWGENGLWEHGIAHDKTLTVPLLMRWQGQPVTRQAGDRRWSR